MNRKLYPTKKVWELIRRARLELVGYCCERCGKPDAEQRFNPNKPHPFYPEGTPSFVYLVLAHQSHYERWKWDAACIVVCPRCHGEMDAELHRRVASLRNYAPVGLVVVWVYYKGGRYLAAEARRFDDLFEQIAQFEEGMKFEVCPEMLMAQVGKGVYRRTSDGVNVLSETGACRTFGTYLHDVLQGVVAFAPHLVEQPSPQKESVQ